MVTDFVQSPGAAPLAVLLAALLAAIFAYLGVSKQVKVANRSVEKQSEVAARTAWWERFTWVADRSLQRQAGVDSLPEDIAISTLNALALAATDEVEKKACRGLVDHLTQAGLVSYSFAGFPYTGIRKHLGRKQRSGLTFPQHMGPRQLHRGQWPFYMKHRF